MENLDEFVSNMPTGEFEEKKAILEQTSSVAEKLLVAYGSNHDVIFNNDSIVEDVITHCFSLAAKFMLARNQQFESILRTGYVANVLMYNKNLQQTPTSAE